MKIFHVFLDFGPHDGGAMLQSTHSTLKLALAAIPDHERNNTLASMYDDGGWFVTETELDTVDESVWVVYDSHGKELKE